MNSQRCFFYFAIGVTVGLLVLPSATQAQTTDRVRTTSGSKLGEITATTPLMVTLEREGQTEEIPVIEIRSILFAEEPSELTQARLRARHGGYDEALVTLSAIRLASVREPYVKQEIEFLTALCHAKLALVGAHPIRQAGTALSQFVNKNTQSYHVLEATELLGDLLRTMGRYDQAQQMYEKLALAPWPAYRIRSHVLVGETLLAQQKYDVALVQFQTALEIDDTSPPLQPQRLAAQLGIGVATAAAGQLQAGVRIVERVIQEADPENAPLLARAYNALGDCYRQADRTKEALFAYLHVDLLYAQVGEAHAEALYHLIPLWEALGKQEQARQARQRLRERYPASSWADRTTSAAATLGHPSSDFTK